MRAPPVGDRRPLWATGARESVLRWRNGAPGPLALSARGGLPSPREGLLLRDVALSLATGAAGRMAGAVRSLRSRRRRRSLPVHDRAPPVRRGARLRLGERLRAPLLSPDLDAVADPLGRVHRRAREADQHRAARPDRPAQ